MATSVHPPLSDATPPATTLPPHRESSQGDLSSTAHAKIKFARRLPPKNRDSIKIGPEHQVELPNINDPATVVTFEPVWIPGKLSNDVIYKFIRYMVQQPVPTTAVHPAHISLQKLYDLLHGANYVVQDALGKVLFENLSFETPQLDSYFTWEERRIFKLALYERGKDFPLLQELYFPTKSFYKLTEFYYLWKRQEGFHTRDLTVQPTYYGNYRIEVVIPYSSRGSAPLPPAPQSPSPPAPLSIDDVGVEEALVKNHVAPEKLGDVQEEKEEPAQQHQQQQEPQQDAQPSGQLQPISSPIKKPEEKPPTPSPIVDNTTNHQSDLSTTWAALGVTFDTDPLVLVSDVVD